LAQVEGIPDTATILGSCVVVVGVWLISVGEHKHDREEEDGMLLSIAYAKHSHAFIIICSAEEHKIEFTTNRDTSLDVSVRTGGSVTANDEEDGDDVQTIDFTAASGVHSQQKARYSKAHNREDDEEEIKFDDLNGKLRRLSGDSYEIEMTPPIKNHDRDGNGSSWTQASVWSQERMRGLFDGKTSSEQKILQPEPRPWTKSRIMSRRRNTNKQTYTAVGDEEDDAEDDGSSRDALGPQSPNPNARDYSSGQISNPIINMTSSVINVHQIAGSPSNGGARRSDEEFKRSSGSEDVV
jgi:hypothetical protein